MFSRVFKARSLIEEDPPYKAQRFIIMDELTKKVVLLKRSMERDKKDQWALIEELTSKVNALTTEVKMCREELKNLSAIRNGLGTQ